MHKIAINEGWLFAKLPGMSVRDSAVRDIRIRDGAVRQGECPMAKDRASVPEVITLPHTWYQEHTPGEAQKEPLTDSAESSGIKTKSHKTKGSAGSVETYRGLALYQKTITADPDWASLYVDIPAADQQARVFVEDDEVAAHEGGYSAFRAEVPPEVLVRAAGDPAHSILIRIFVSNEVSTTISPLTGDFAIYGGLYRGVNLIPARSAHFDYLYYGTDGVIVRPGVSADGTGILTIEPHAVAEADAVIHYTVFDPEGKKKAECTAPRADTVTFTVPDPAYWNGRHAAPLYRVRAELQVHGVVTDTVEKETGFRCTRVDPDHGFFLNGHHLFIRGVSMHQDMAGVYNAVSEQDVKKSFSIIGEIGANAVRLSHYQHAQYTYELADREGYVVWAEIPMLKMPDNPEVFQNAESQLRELILQNIHHPSICFWGIQNEIGMFRDAPFMHEELRRMKQIARSLDPDRSITCANLYTVKFKSELNNITDMVGCNIYFGWYYGKMEDYDAFLDRFHRERPDMPVGVSEYGVDASPALHSDHPVVRDYSEEYQALFHETVYPILRSKSYLWGSFVWNMFDFVSPMRREGGAVNRNQKGLVTFDRTLKKDAFYYYKAQWSREPFVHICSRRFVKRAAERIDIKVYTNQPEAALSVNGQDCGKRPNNGNGIVSFEQVPLQWGDNRIEVSAGGVCDACSFERVEQPEASYTLPDSGAGSAVRNWFLKEGDIRREGYYSVEDTANDLIEDRRTLEVLKRYLPQLTGVMLSGDAIPLGLSLRSILSRSSSGEDVRELNAALNQIPVIPQ